MATVVTVLRSGGEFGPEHVQAVQRQVWRYAPPGTGYACLSDVPVPGVRCWPLKYNWPGWWAKLELFRPDLKGDFLFTDLDNIILGPIDDLLTEKDFMLQWGGWTALMYLPDAMRHEVWNDFIANPKQQMKKFAQENQPRIEQLGNYGDAGFISSRPLQRGTRYWEIAYPGQTPNIAGLRYHSPVGGRWLSVPAEARILLCGQPYRPWKVGFLRSRYWCQESI